MGVGYFTYFKGNIYIHRHVFIELIVLLYFTVNISNLSFGGTFLYNMGFVLIGCFLALSMACC